MLPSQLSSSIYYEIISYRVDQSRLSIESSETLNESLLCSICQEVAYKPEECSVCQSLFCSDCIKTWLEKKAKCPLDCPPPFTSHKPHKVIRQALGALKYCCNFKANGCEEIITLDNLEKHEGKCNFSMIKCPFSNECSAEFLRKECDEHQKICEFFLLRCEKCDFEIKRKDFNSHDCIKYLKEKYIKLNKNFEDFKEFHEKQLEILTKKLSDIELSFQNNEKKLQKINQLEKVCQRGHLLHWTKGDEIKECDLCKKKGIFSRFSCSECELKYCIYCIYPDLSKKKCPLGHDMMGCSKLVWHSCDMCRKGLDKENEVYTDRDCDFDVCGACFSKASK